MDTRDYLEISLEVAFPQVPEKDRLPIIDWYNEDKSKYALAKDVINPKTGRRYIDPDEDFLIDDKGRFLLNENFVLVNTHWFKRTGEVFEKNGKYIDLDEDDPEYDIWVETEEYRRANGMTLPCKLLKSDVKAYNAAPRKERHKFLKPLHITGELYNFINYGRIMRTEESSTGNGIITATKKLGLPRFFYSQYWWTKAKLFARRNGFNHVVLKSRRAGWSFQEAIDSANDVNLIPEITEIFAAYSDNYLTQGRAIAPMAKTQLEFYEEHTPFNRCGIKEDGTAVGLLKKDLDDLQLGYRDKSGTPHGFLSKLITAVFGPANPDAAIGKDAYKIKVEELSNAPNLPDFMNVTEPTTKAGSLKVGMIIGFGTGGSTQGDWKEFKAWYFNPLKYDAMPFVDVYDPNARSKTIGYFKPYVMNLEGYDSRGVPGMDIYGNPNYVAATNIFIKERADKKSGKDVSLRDYLVYCGQYSNMPTESFAISQDSIFVSDGLIKHAKQVETGEVGDFYRDGWLERDVQGKVRFISNAKLKLDNKDWHRFLTSKEFKKGDDIHGALREWYPPFYNEDGIIPKGLYKIYYDPVAIDKELKKVTDKNSLNTVYVVMQPNNLIPGNGDMIVAEWSGRMATTEEAHKFILLLADYYNAQVLPEVDRGNIVDRFKAWGRRDRLAKTPTRVHDYTIKGVDSNQYGVVLGSHPNLKIDALDWFKEWLYQQRGLDENGEPLYNYHFIYSPALLEELLTYNLEDNFDRISTMLIKAIDVQDYIFGKKHRQHKPKTNKKSIFKRNWY